MRTLFQDYETFFGPVVLPGPQEFYKNGKPKKPKTFNLSLKNNNVSYTDYVRHPEFEVLGVSLRWEDEEEARFYRPEEISAVYAEIDWSNVRIVAHNAIFEGLINFEIYGIVPAEYFCTLAAAEALLQGSVAVGLDNLAKVFGVGEKLPDLQDFKGLRAADLTEEQWETLARYTNNDVDLTVPLYHIFRGMLPDDEIRLMAHTLKLFAHPRLHVDVELAREALKEATEERDTLVAKTGLELEQISGNITFREALRGKLGWIPQKLNDKNEIIPAFAKTDLEFIKLKSHPDEGVRNLVEARLEVKSNLGINRAQRLIKLGETGTGLLPVCLHYARAHTMRWTGGNKVNLQNLPRGSKLRRAIKAPPGYVLLVVDSAQIECRTLAWVAGQEDLLEQFRGELDPYGIMAEKVFGFPVSKDPESPHYHPDERFMGKTMVLGLGYGMGWMKFLNEILTGARGKAMQISPEFAQMAVNIYRSSNDKIVRFWTYSDWFLEYLVYGQELMDAADVVELKTGGTETLHRGLFSLDPDTKRVLFPNGTFLRYADLNINDEGEYQYRSMLKDTIVWKKIYGGLFTENFAQKLARDVVASQVLKIAEEYDPALLVHDEGVFLVPEAKAEEAYEFALEVFKENLPYTDIPLGSEGGYDVCYSK